MNHIQPLRVVIGGGCLFVGGQAVIHLFSFIINNGLGDIMTVYINFRELIEIEAYRNYGFEAYDIKSKSERSGRRLNSRSFFSGLSKKAFFITSVPFYWFIIFQYIVGSFNLAFFVFVCICSLLLSVTGMNWGVLNSMARA